MEKIIYESKDYTIKFNAANHRYTKETEGKKESVPSVSSILGLLDKPAILYWSIKKTVGYIGEHLPELRAAGLTEDGALEILKKAKEFANEQAKEQAYIGTQVHKLLHQYLLGEKVYENDLDEKVLNAYTGAIEWLKDVNFQPLGVEQSVYHPILEYAGTLDTYGTARDKTILLDWKTTDIWKEKNGKVYYTEQPYTEMKVQPVAYAEALANMKEGLKIDEVWVIRLDKNTGKAEPYLIEGSERSACWNVFLGLLDVKAGLKDIKQNTYKGGGK